MQLRKRAKQTKHKNDIEALFVLIYFMELNVIVTTQSLDQTTICMYFKYTCILYSRVGNRLATFRKRTCSLV